MSKPKRGIVETRTNSGVAFLCLVIAMTLTSCKSEPGAPHVERQPMSASAEFLLQAGSEALRRHEFVEAFAYADSAESIAPELADIPFLRGRIHSELARLDLADSLYRRTLEIRPDYPGAWNNLGNTAFRLQNYSEAIADYRRELESHPDPRPWRGIGRAFVELGKTDSARAAFERATEMDSTFSQAHFSMALLLENDGDFDGALAAANRAVANDPGNPEYRYYAASYLARVGRTGEAISQLQLVIEEWPWHRGAHYNMGQALMRLGRTDEALAFQERAEQLRELQAQISHHENTVRVQPTSALAHAGLATLLRRAGRYNDAMHAYRAALYLDPANLDYKNNMAVLHLLRGDTTAAIATFEGIVRADSTNTHAWINLGSLYAMSGVKPKARTAWSTALRLEPGNEMARSSLNRLDRSGE